MADCQQENFYLSQVKIWKEMEKSPLALAKTQGRRLHYFQPANQILHFSGGYIFSAREHLSNQARQIAWDCRFSTSQETIS